MSSFQTERERLMFEEGLASGVEGNQELARLLESRDAELKELREHPDPWARVICGDESCAECKPMHDLVKSEASLRSQLEAAVQLLDRAAALRLTPAVEGALWRHDFASLLAEKEGSQ